MSRRPPNDLPLGSQVKRVGQGPRVLHLIGGEPRGGAARGALWLHQGLLEAGVDSRALVQLGNNDPTRRIYSATPNALARWRAQLLRGLDRSLLRLHPRRGEFVFSPGFFGIDIRRSPLVARSDILHLHWINEGFIDIALLPQLARPLVWTLRDFWPFTGGCHYTHRTGCIRYQDHCHDCPELGSGVKHDLSWWGMRRKRRAYQVRPAPVAISQWLGDRARESALFKNQRVRVIHNAVDEQIFRPHDRTTARRRWEGHPDKKIILFGNIGAFQDPRKGGAELLASLARLQASQMPEWECWVFGASKLPPGLDSCLPLRAVGAIGDDEMLAALYSAADVYVAPSLQEAFGKTVAEAQSCGTPVVAFEGGGPAEIVDHETTGYLAKSGSESGLAEGIRWVLTRSQSEAVALSHACRERACRLFSLERAAARYRALYEELWQDHGARA